MVDDDVPDSTFTVATPALRLSATAQGESLVRIAFGGPDGPPPAGPFEGCVATELRAYLAGKLREFTIPIRLTGSEFQLAVWNEIAGIPYGTTMTYGEVAKTIGKPGGARAVGSAANANPVPIVIPCHRVVGRRGALVGFGGGLDVKRKLLDIETRNLIDLPSEIGYLSAVQ